MDPVYGPQNVDPAMSSSGFAQLPQATDVGKALSPFRKEDVKGADDAWSDENALGVVLTDIATTIKYYQSKGLVPLGIENADDLVRAYVRPRQWPDGKSRANLSMHVTMQAIEKILPQLYMSLFGTGKKRPFVVDPLGKTSEGAARANATLLSWAMKQSKAKEEFRVSMKTALTYGFLVGSWGWQSKKQRLKEYKADRSDGGKSKPKATWKEEDIEIPFYEACDLKMVGVDPILKRQDLHQGARFVWKQSFTDGYGLADFRADSTYKNIPTDDQLAFFLANKSEPTTDEVAADKRAVWREFQAEVQQAMTYHDPMMQPLEILEYTTPDRVVTVLQRKIVIRNEANEFGRFNYQSCAFVDVLGSAWGFGVAKLLAGEQRLQQGVINNYIDSLALVLNPVFQLLKGIGPGTQSIPVSPGKVITESGELKPLVVPDVSKPALESVQASQMRADEKVSANGGSNMPNSAMRTAQGVQAFASDVIVRLQYWLETFVNLVYIPTLEAFLEMMHDHLTPAQIDSILTEEEGKAYEGDINEVYNAQVNVQPIAGANMMAKFAASQLMPMVISLVSAGPVSDQFEVQGKKFNYVEFITEGIELMGWDVEALVQDMTPADLQRVQQRNQAMQQAQGKLLLQNQKHQGDLENIDAKASGQAGVAVIRSVLKDNMGAAEQELNLEPQGTSNGQ